MIKTLIYKRIWLPRLTGVYLLDFFFSSFQFYLLLSPYLCFISLLYLDLYVLGDDALISHGFLCKPNICVSIHIWTKGEVGVPLNRFMLSSKIFYWPFQGILLLWIIYVISVLFCYAFMHVCLLLPCGHLLGKGWPLSSRLWCLIVTLSLSHWYPESGMALDCTNSWSLFAFLLNIFWKLSGKTCIFGASFSLVVIDINRKLDFPLLSHFLLAQ